MRQKIQQIEGLSDDEQTALLHIAADSTPTHGFSRAVGVLIQTGESYHYSGGMIENDTNTDGWSRLELATI